MARPSRAAQRLAADVLDLLGGARAAYERFHWGEPARRVRRVPVEPPRVLVEIGELEAVVYRTRKGGERASWMHDHSRPRPRLAFDAETGRLHIIGGRYRITDAGIED